MKMIETNFPEPTTVPTDVGRGESNPAGPDNDAVILNKADSKAVILAKAPNQAEAGTQWVWRPFTGPRDTKTVLIVDDDPVLRDSLAEVLRMEHFQPMTAGDGMEALNAVSRQPVDLVLLDLQMPGMSGWSTFRALVESNPYLPVIIITALSQQEDLADSLGADAIMTKPPDIAQLLALVRDMAYETPEQRFNRLGQGKRNFRRFTRSPNGRIDSPLND